MTTVGDNDTSEMPREEIINDIFEKHKGAWTTLAELGKE